MRGGYRRISGLLDMQVTLASMRGGFRGIDGLLDMQIVGEGWKEGRDMTLVIALGPFTALQHSCIIILLPD